MKKLFKILAAVAVIIVVLIVGAVILISVTLDKAVKVAIEKGGTYALGVETTLDKADVQVMAQAFEMEGLLVANPEGFESHFISLGKAGIALDGSTLQAEVIEIPVLTINDLDMNLLKNDNGSNYKIILNIYRVIGSSLTCIFPVFHLL